MADEQLAACEKETRNYTVASRNEIVFCAKYWFLREIGEPPWLAT